MAMGIIVFLLALIFTRSRAGIVSGLIGFLAFSIMARTGMKAVACKPGCCWVESSSCCAFTL